MKEIQRCEQAKHRKTIRNYDNLNCLAEVLRLFWIFKRICANYHNIELHHKTIHQLSVSVIKKTISVGDSLDQATAKCSVRP
jgi:hypothetical protein